MTPGPSKKKTCNLAETLALAQPFFPLQLKRSFSSELGLSDRRDQYRADIHIYSKVHIVMGFPGATLQNSKSINIKIC